MQNLANAIAASYIANNATVTTFQTVDFFTFLGYTNGWTCINQSKHCVGDNRFAIVVFEYVSVVYDCGV